MSLALKTRGQVPLPADLRADADCVAPRGIVGPDPDDRSTLLPAPVTIPVPDAGLTVRVTREWRYYCEDCSDAGWRSLWCGPGLSLRAPWMAPQPCGRAGEHGGHDWSQRCACWESNPKLLRQRAAAAQKYATAPARADARS